MAGIGEAPREAGGGEDDRDHHRGKRGLCPGGAPQRRRVCENHGENHGKMVDLTEQKLRNMRTSWYF